MTVVGVITNDSSLGFIAHEVQEIFPMLVTGEKDGENHQTVNGTGLIPVLVLEIQRLKLQVKTLQNQLIQQQGQIHELFARMKSDTSTP